VNLFSLNRALKNGFTISNKELSMCLSKGQVSVIFDRVLRTTYGFVSGVKLSVFSPPVIYNSTTMICQDKRVNVNKFHERMGHCGTEKLQKTSNILGFKLIGNIEVCQVCALAKARQKNFNKEWKGGSQVPGERIYFDISFVRDLSFGGAKFWF
jgi:GAG-pre-integrase domain